MNRRLAREKALQALFQMDMTGEQPENAIQSVMEDNPENPQFVRDLVMGTLEHQAAIDQTISGFLRGWTLGRLSYVDRAILRMAAYELLYREDIPEKVTVNEAIELSKSFSTGESTKFINGVLSNIINSSRSKEGVGEGDL